MTIHPVGADLFHADGQTNGRTDGRKEGKKDGWTDKKTDRHDEVYRRFPQFCKCAKKPLISV